MFYTFFLLDKSMHGRLMKKATDWLKWISGKYYKHRPFKEYHGNPKKINFQLYYRQFSQQMNSILSYYYRRVTRWRRGRSLSCTFLKIGRKWPVLRKRVLNLVIFGLNVSFKMQFVSLFSRKIPKFLPAWPFNLQFLMKCFSGCYNSKKAPLPKFPVMRLYYNDLLRIALRKNRF